MEEQKRKRNKNARHGSREPTRDLSLLSKSLYRKAAKIAKCTWKASSRQHLASTTYVSVLCVLFRPRQDAFRQCLGGRSNPRLKHRNLTETGRKPGNGESRKRTSSLCTGQTCGRGTITSTRLRPRLAKVAMLCWCWCVFVSEEGSGV